jgi:ABC-type bacteriocin/lantibiotic exporter with double-glycine peptidase domain
MKKIISLLNKNQKKRLLIISLVAIILSIFEFLTFSLIEPLINLFSNSSGKNEIKIFSILNFETNISNKFIIYFFLISFLLRSFLSLLIIYLKSSLGKNINDYLSNKLYTYYLNREYSFFLNNSSSKFNSNIIKEVDNFAYKVMDSLIYFATDILIITTVLSYLSLTYPIETLILLLISFSMFLTYYLFFKGKLKKLGKIYTNSTASRLKFLEDSFYIIQNIKLDQSQNLFIKKFNELTTRASNSSRKTNFILESPRGLIEITMLIVVIILVVNLFYFFKVETKTFVPLIGLFVFAMFRILPSSNRVLIAFSSIKAFYESVKVIKNELKNYENYIHYDDEGTEIDLKRIDKVEFENVSFEYNKNNKIFNKVNVDLTLGKSIGIIGENGSGKSTLLNLICGLLDPSSGKVTINNLNIQNIKKIFQKKIGYVPQKVYLSDDTIKNNICLGQEDKDFDQNSFMEAMKISKMDQVIEKFELKENTNVGQRGIKLSGGQQQRLGIARALYKKPKILILDEATNALDHETEINILHEIHQLKKKILLIQVSHNRNVQILCDELYELNLGRIKKIK